MKREIIKDLLKWKESSNRKPLIVHGARQVGKTYIIKQFGKEKRVLNTRKRTECTGDNRSAYLEA